MAAIAALHRSPLDANAVPSLATTPSCANLDEGITTCFHAQQNQQALSYCTQEVVKRNRAATLGFLALKTSRTSPFFQVCLRR